MNKNLLLLCVKLLVLAGGIALIIFQTDLSRLGNYLKTMSPWFLTLAIFTYSAAQIISAFRGKYYFKRHRIRILPRFAIALYFVGMLYNHILPGGIGGDGYKVFVVSKLFHVSKLKTVGILLRDRASGLHGLCLTILALSCFSPTIHTLPYYPFFIAAGWLILTLGYFISSRIILREHRRIAIGAIPYSLAVQTMVVLVATLILTGLGYHQAQGDLVNYLMLFQIASALSILPISIGGAGIREAGFIFGAPLLGLEAELGVALAIIFFIVNLLCALYGLCFIHRLKDLK